MEGHSCGPVPCLLQKQVCGDSPGTLQGFRDAAWDNAVPKLGFNSKGPTYTHASSV
jgi:hypothetical protein